MPFVDFTATATPEFKEVLNNDIANYNKWTTASSIVKWTLPAVIAALNVINLVLDNSLPSNKTAIDSTFNGVQIFVSASAAALMGIFSNFSGTSQTAVQQDITNGIKQGYLPTDFNATNANLTFFPALQTKVANTKPGDLNTVQQVAADAHFATAILKR